METSVLRSFVGKRCLVTGGTGMIGRQVVDLLCGADAKVFSVSLDSLQPNSKAGYLLGDLTDFSYCRKMTKDMNYVFHLAGIKGSAKVTIEKPASFFVPLLMMNTNILEACRVTKVEKVVYTSSIGAYPSAEIFRENEGYIGDPMDMFPGWAKRMGEIQIQTYRIQYGLDNFACVRPCNVYGPGDNFDPNNAMVIPSLMAKIARGDNPVVIWGDGSAIRDFAYSKDIAEGIILALHYGTNSNFVNLGSGVGYSIKELVENLLCLVDFNYEFDPTKPSGYPKRVMDISLARELIHYNPTTILLDGLKKTWDWFVENRNEYLKRKSYF